MKCHEHEGSWMGHEWEKCWCVTKWSVINLSINQLLLPQNEINKTLEKELEYDREAVEIELAENPCEEIYDRQANIKKELETIYNERAKGMQICAKCTHIELKEHCSKYFFIKEKSQSQNKNITCLQIDKNNIMTCKHIILEKQREFYENLYSERTRTKITYASKRKISWECQTFRV
jgi:hypothetical protein